MGSYKKKLFIVLLLILLLGFFVCGSVNAASYNYSIDNQKVLQTYQEYLSQYFFNILKNNNDFKEVFKTDVANKYTLFNYYKDNNGNTYISCNIYSPTINFYNLTEVDTTSMEFDDGYLLIPTSGYNINASDMGQSEYYTYILNVQTNGIARVRRVSVSFFLPTLLIYYQNQNNSNYLNGLDPSVNLWSMLFSKIDDNTEQQAETTEELKKLNNFMSSEDVDQDAYDMPTNNPTQDPTTDGINNIFNLFYNRITSWDSSSINVYIPFANKSFTIPANASEQLLNHFSNIGLGSTLKSLISAVWFYVLARYIIKDVQKYADGLKTGEILTKSDTNIKTEML